MDCDEHNHNYADFRKVCDELINFTKKSSLFICAKIFKPWQES